MSEGKRSLSQEKGPSNIGGESQGADFLSALAVLSELTTVACSAFREQNKWSPPLQGASGATMSPGSKRANRESYEAERALEKAKTVADPKVLEIFEKIKSAPVQQAAEGLATAVKDRQHAGTDVSDDLLQKEDQAKQVLAQVLGVSKEIIDVFCDRGVCYVSLIQLSPKTAQVPIGSYRVGN